MTPRRKWFGAMVALAVAISLSPSVSAGGGPTSPPKQNVLDGPVDFYVEPNSNARRQAAIWAAEGRAEDAALMNALAHVSQAAWFTSGSPADVRAGVHKVVTAAKKERQLPVVVAYFVPARDCSQYSAGGAQTEAEYRAWIDGFSAGIGNRPAVVILEPDGLALLSSEPWCEIGGGGFSGLPEDMSLVEERFREINYALDRLARNRRAAVYIDAGHSAWQPLNDYDAGYGEPSFQLGMASRLIRGGIHKAHGFYLNVSNYRSNAELVSYGTQLSKCLYLRMEAGADTCTDEALAAVPEDPSALTHFVLDTSRNGRGHWTPPPGVYSDPQDWCNPPGRGLGARPTTDTGNELVDAFLWVKRPGESDGQCTRGTPGPEDPEYGQVDPPAGQWWPEYALGLAQRAEPPLSP